MNQDDMIRLINRELKSENETLKKQRDEIQVKYLNELAKSIKFKKQNAELKDYLKSYNNFVDDIFPDLTS
ncbi:hypothetical protein METROID_230 [Staphylococcus phage Metroid]|nr:hypothetical protein METROID_230 [Staphylococcus phage Metroid]